MIFVNNKVMIAKSDGTIVNSANNPVSDLSYSDGSLTIMDSRGS